MGPRHEMVVQVPLGYIGSKGVVRRMYEKSFVSWILGLIYDSMFLEHRLVYLKVYEWLFIDVCVCMYVCVFVCVCVWCM